ncbi:helix-turn-helix domain-containing protein [Aliarcobacter butzleri]|uniref:helix-turn-helix domain-containing protein n=1 Tax=Aliarcobacter butzleri TaxID=28197 RepID=UPI00102D72E6|nr:helix-turn-helix transcriptional regulator [Aliarcobacter butzleri]RZV18666.1 XRE family transcriptional regulator [Aliarcobacter butzleri]
MNEVEFTEEMLLSFYKRVSKNVIRLRKEKKISQLKLANAIGHQNATFLGKAELLAEGKHFNLEHLVKIAHILKVDINEFFRE